MSVTMNDIARAAGASVSTVGRVIHNSGYVSREVRERVERAIERLGYVPNQSARALKSSRSGIIGSLVLQSANGLYYRINDSIIRAARAAGYELLTMEAQPGQGMEGHLIDSFIGLHVDGLAIISNTSITGEMFAKLRAAAIPVVAVERGYLEMGVDSLVVRDLEGSRDAVQRIVCSGHKRVALVAPRPALDVEKRRYAGYREGLESMGLGVDERLIRLTPGYDTQYGRIAGADLLSLPEPPTAVFCTADTLAAGVLQAAYQKGLRVPEDLSLVGYDDVLSQSLSPALNSVGLFMGSIGPCVMELIEARRADPERPAEARMIDTVYADRGTVAVRSARKETVIRIYDEEELL